MSDPESGLAVFLELAIQRGLADAEHACRAQLIAAAVFDGAQDRFPLHVGERHDVLGGAASSAGSPIGTRTGVFDRSCPPA